jgi:hypothetical protein
MAIDAGLFEDNTAPDFSQSFVGYVEDYGRSFELGLATRNFLRHQPLGLVETAQLGLGMFSRGRIDLTPQKIEGTKQLQAILKRAKELESEG